MIVPCGLTASLPEAQREQLLDKCGEIAKQLKAAGVRVKEDYRDNYSPGWKFNHWELKVLIFIDSLLMTDPVFGTVWHLLYDLPNSDIS